MLFDFGQQSNVQWSAVLTGGSTNANANGSAIDCAGFSGVSVALIVGATGTASAALNTANALTLGFREGDDTDVANATALASGNIIKSENATSFNSVAHYSIRPTKRYVFPEVRKTNASATHTNANVAVAGFLGFPNSAPTD